MIEQQGVDRRQWFIRMLLPMAVQDAEQIVMNAKGHHFVRRGLMLT